MNRALTLALSAALFTGVCWVAPQVGVSVAIAEDKEPSAVDKATAAYKDYKQAQTDGNKELTALSKAYREAKTEDEKAEIQKKYNDLRAELSKKNEQLLEEFMTAFNKAGQEAFDSDKDGELLGFAIFQLAMKKDDADDMKGAVELYELLLKRAPKSNEANNVRTYYLPASLIELGDMAVAAKRVDELIKDVAENQKPGLMTTKGDILALGGDPDAAAKIYAEALKSIPEKLERGDPRASAKSYLDTKSALIGKQAPEVDSKNWIGGEAHKLSAFKGKVVIVDLWATWCGPCRHAMIGLNEMHKKLAAKGFTAVGITKVFPYGSMPPENAATTKDAMEKVTQDEALQALSNEYNPKMAEAQKALKDAKTDEEKKDLQAKLDALKAEFDGKVEKQFQLHVTEFHKRAKIEYPFIVAGDDTIKAFHLPAWPTMAVIDRSGKIVYVQVGSGRDKAMENLVEKLLEAK